MSVAVPSPRALASGFHDAECAGYLADLPLWLALAETVGAGRILDLGAGTGRVSIPLAAAGHEVTAVDLDPDLLAELAARAARAEVSVDTIAADLREMEPAAFAPGGPASLVLVPMQTIQLLGGPQGRVAMFRGAARIAAPGAELVISVVTQVEPFDGRDAFPALLPPDIATLEGFRFDSTPMAVLQDTPQAQIDMHRRRVVRDLAGHIVGTPVDVVITLDPITVGGLQEEAAAGDWDATEVVAMPPTDEHAGATVMTFRLREDAST